MHPLLSIKDLTIDFLSENQATTAVKNISLDVHRGEIVALVGESGSGKSVTSLSILKLLPKPPARYTNGNIFFSDDGQKIIDLVQISQQDIQQIRGQKIAMIFQEPMTSLNPVMNCGRQVMEAILIHKKISKDAARQQVIEWFEKVKLPEPVKMFDRFPHQLSGGQKQRVMIAMAMICKPSILICDEPTTALDVTVQKTILELIKELQQQQNMGVIFITHDLGVVAEIADRVAIMYKGEIVEEGKTDEIFRDPAHPYTRALIACRPALHQKGERLPVVSDFMEENVDGIRDVTLQEAKAESKKENLLLDIKQITIKFPSKRNLLGKVTGSFTAVDNVSLAIYEGETLGLVGESGCGKTTLGRAILKLIEPESGKILYRSNNITQLSREQIKELRKNVQLIFQDPYSSLNPRLTIGDAIAEPMKVSSILKTGKERKKMVEELLDRVNLSPAIMNRYPHEFSGGQRQRIVIARALALNPGFLVCDESVSALDVSVQAQVLNLLNQLKNDLGLTMLFISHDLSVVHYMCDRIAVMNKGKIIESGPADDIYYRPQNHYTKKLIDAIPAVS